MTLAAITPAILDQSSSSRQQRAALDEFVRQCVQVTGIDPDPGFDAWAGDSLLESGVAINPRAAAHCVRDYRRTVVFLGGVYAAIREAQRIFPDRQIRILYAGSGPYATLLLPLLPLFQPAEIQVQLLDVHQRALDSVGQLIDHFGFGDHLVNTVQGDACTYQHHCSLHLVIAETMQKALEQEPQLAVTANLAPQLCPRGLFIPERVEVELCLARLSQESEVLRRGGKINADALEQAGERHVLGTAIQLTGATAAQLPGAGHPSKGAGVLELASFEIPDIENLASFDTVLFTRIKVFHGYMLGDYESEITLPLNIHESRLLKAGDSLRVNYEMGSYPRFFLSSASL